MSKIKLFISVITLSILFSNWSLILFINNKPLLLIIVIATISSLLCLLKNQLHYILITVLCIMVLSFYQYTLTENSLLQPLKQDEIYLKNTRVYAYPNLNIRIGEYDIGYIIGNILDGRFETIVLFRMQKNLFDALDLNYYFFGSHPRERVGIPEFERLPFFLLPFFLAGIFLVQIKKNKLFILSSFLAPLILISYVGINSSMGAFVMYPFVVSVTGYGLYQILNRFLIRKQ